jgi:integrase
VIRHSIYQDKSGKTTQAPKSGHSRRVAIGRGLADLLKRYRRASSDDDYVWPGKDGPMSRDTPGQLLERTLDRAGLVDPNGKPLVTFHDLRHTRASIALARGVPLITVSRQPGHARVDITAKTYAHLLEDRQLDDFADAHER